MKYWYWIFGAVVLGGTGVVGYYYGPSWLDVFNQNTHKNNEADISSPHSGTDLSSNWDLLIQAAKAGRNAELVASVLMGKHLLFGIDIFGTNKYKISNVASNGDVTFEYEVLSVDVKVPDWVRQSMLDEGYTAPDVTEDTKTATEDLDLGRIIGYTQKSIFTKASFISMIEDWKVGSFSIGNWGSFEDIGSLSPSPDYIKVFTVQCADNDWDCLIQAANVGNNARLLVSSQIEEDALESGLIYSSTNEYKISNVASNGDVDFGYVLISVDIKLSSQLKHDMVGQGATETEIEQYVKELETSRGVGFGESSTFPKASFIALIKKWQSGSFSILDFSNYHTGDWGAGSSSLNDTNTPTSTTPTGTPTVTSTCFTEDLPEQFGNYANLQVGEKVCSGSVCATISKMDSNAVYFSFSGTSDLIKLLVNAPAFKADNSLLVRVCQVKTGNDGTKYAHVKFGKASQSPSLDNSNFIDGSRMGL